MELYNRALVNALRAQKGGEIDLSPRRLALPFGQMELTSNTAEFIYAGLQFTSFISVEDFKIHGLLNHYRKPGIGAALAARVKTFNNQVLSPWLRQRSVARATSALGHRVDYAASQGPDETADAGRAAVAPIQDALEG